MTSNFLQKVIGFRALKWKDGKLIIWNVPGFLSQLYTVVYQQRLMENQFGTRNTMETFYNTGKFQARKGVEMFNKRFGFSQKIQDIEKLLEFNIGQSEFVGLGRFQWVKLDFENEIFICVGKSSFAEEYKKFFGIQKGAVDHLIRGCATASIEAVLNKKMLGIETNCVGEGKPFCQIVVRPIEKWDRKIPRIKNQWANDLPDMKKLGAQKESFFI
jgi:predicted hydrocarbon binding protein